MAHDVITLLRRHDPAAALRPLPESEAGAMRDVIVRSAAAVHRRRRRWPVAALAAAAVALVGGAAVYSSIMSDDTAPTVRREYAQVKLDHRPASGRPLAAALAAGELAFWEELRARVRTRAGAVRLVRPLDRRCAKRRRRGCRTVIRRGGAAAAHDAAPSRRSAGGRGRLHPRDAARDGPPDRRRPQRRARSPQAVPAGELLARRGGAAQLDREREVDVLVDARATRRARRRARGSGRSRGRRASRAPRRPR